MKKIIITLEIKENKVEKVIKELEKLLENNDIEGAYDIETEKSNRYNIEIKETKKIKALCEKAQSEIDWKYDLYSGYQEMMGRIDDLLDQIIKEIDRK
jgi:hypothetical protein